jgi:hypothetical protein
MREICVDARRSWEMGGKLKREGGRNIRDSGSADREPIVSFEHGDVGKLASRS